MNKDNMNIQEDAKSDWMKIVSKHKKKQKGLPALSKLNTNAGNVEHNINMFNMMSSGCTDATVDAVNGNVSCGGCSAGMGESLTETKNSENIVIHYTGLPIEVVTKRGNPTGYYDYGMQQWYPDDDDETTELLVDWDFELPEMTVIEFLQDLPQVQSDLNFDRVSEQEFDAALQSNLNELIDRYEDELKEYFYDMAKEDAQENYEYEYTDSYDLDDYSDKKLDDYKLDDVFDMSMRTLL